MQSNKLKKKKILLMDFALGRQFLDPYHSGGDEVDSPEGSRAEEENVGVTVLTVILRSGKCCYYVRVIYQWCCFCGHKRVTPRGC